jgi:hypothetical protein
MWKWKSSAISVSVIAVVEQRAVVRMWLMTYFESMDTMDGGLRSCIIS